MIRFIFTITTILFTSLTLNAKNYTYLVDEYTKDTELEAKIIIKIAKDMLKNQKIKIYIPNIKNLDRKIYSKNAIVVDTCKNANFVFIKYGANQECFKTNGFYLFTNNYKKLMNNKNYLGAFFWSKSRPNIVFIKDRLSKKDITLPNEYAQFVEDF